MVLNAVFSQRGISTFTYAKDMKTSFILAKILFRSTLQRCAPQFNSSKCYELLGDTIEPMCHQHIQL